MYLNVTFHSVGYNTIPQTVPHKVEKNNFRKQLNKCEKKLTLKARSIDILNEQFLETLNCFFLVYKNEALTSQVTRVTTLRDFEDLCLTSSIQKVF